MVLKHEHFLSGVRTERHYADNDGKRAAYRWDAPVRDLARDLDVLHFRPLSVDREGTLRAGARLEELLDGLLEVRIRGSFWWTMGLTWRAIELIGLEQLMLCMYDQPAELHRLMAFLRDEHLHHVELA